MPTRMQQLDRMLKGKEPYPDKRKGGDRHRPGYKPPRPRTTRSKQVSKWERRRIIAWDGEGANNPDGSHVYNLLNNSEGDYLVNIDGIPTQDALNFLLDHNDHLAINVIFGGSYDVNMILGDLPEDKVKALWLNGWVNWQASDGAIYKIAYAHRKRFSVKRATGYNGRRVLWTKPFMLWDVLGFYQASFVAACRKWLGELEVLDQIEIMKSQRSEFSADRIGEIIEYSQAECKLLVILVEALFRAMDEADIQLTRYDGAGAIAGALLRKYGVKDHKGSFDDVTQYVAQCAYGGGRIEAPKIGNVERGTVFRYDINSAYPSHARNLPSLRGARLVQEYEWDGSDYSLVHVVWNIKSALYPFYPLWYREFDGSIYYPRAGEGLFWGAEVRNLVKFFDPRDYAIVSGYNLKLDDDTKPFAFIDDVYAARRRFKERNSMAHEALKLGMNSIYGKLAQQAGYRNGRVPTYHQLMWAGMITAGCRAQLFNAAMQDPEAVIAFATDAIITTRPFNLPLGTNLGAWTPEAYGGITIAQPGVYWLKNEDESWETKYRGFDKDALDRKRLIEAWRNGDPMVARLTRFVGMGGALMSTEFGKTWRRWIVTNRQLDIWPGGKREAGNDVEFWDHLCDTKPVEVGTGMSFPYPLLWAQRGPQLERPKVDGIDVRIVEEELLDSYA